MTATLWLFGAPARELPYQTHAIGGSANGPQIQQRCCEHRLPYLQAPVPDGVCTCDMFCAGLHSPLPPAVARDHLTRHHRGQVGAHLSAWEQPEGDREAAGRRLRQGVGGSPPLSQLSCAVLVHRVTELWKPGCLCRLSWSRVRHQRLFDQLQPCLFWQCMQCRTVNLCCVNRLWSGGAFCHRTFARVVLRSLLRELLECFFCEAKKPRETQTPSVERVATVSVDPDYALCSVQMGAWCLPASKPALCAVTSRPHTESTLVLHLC